MSRRKWTESRILAEARKYRCREAWRLGSPYSYEVASKTGLLRDPSMAEVFPNHGNVRMTREQVLQEAAKHPSRHAWRAAHLASYKAASRHDWLYDDDFMTVHCIRRKQT